MKLRRNFILKCIFDICRKLRSKKYFIILLTLLYFLNYEFTGIFKIKNEENGCTRPIDVVYTWVNGSDQVFIDTIRKYDPNYDPARFDDKNELKYSLRSLEKYAPWIRHIYIVTNGQIPYWINLESDRVTIVPHTQIVPDKNVLPIFSSSAIETFIHRIPNLSKNFLYLNDDIFLGAPLYPEDLITDSEGVKVYTAWLVPDCAADCPWVYIGDGACDVSCNIDACQYDGGDCVYSVEDHETEASIQPTIEQNFYDVPKVIRNESSHLKFTNSLRYFYKTSRTRSFNEVIKNQKNVTLDDDLKKMVDNFNQEQKHILKTRQPHGTDKSLINSSKDIYAQSLVYTNKLFNIAYGFKSRKVLAHVGFLLNRDIVEAMTRKFARDVKRTLLHRFRYPTDLQFAFAYYHYLMDETYNLTVSEIFDELDTDNSSTWSDREIRTLLARIYPVSLDWAVVKYFEDVVTNCSRELGLDKIADTVQYTTLVYERYEDSNIPVVTKELVTKCSPLVEALRSNFAKRARYKFHINSKVGMYSNFKMLTSNISEVVDALDELRRSPKKFNCINDNLDPEYTEDNQLVRYLLEDFYLSFFPKESSFELPNNYRNRFKYVDDFYHWQKQRQFTILVVYFFSAIICGIGLNYICCHKTKYARKLIPYKCCDI